MSQRLFTVIIPLYNKELYIEKTVKSVLDQTVTDFELLIIDDGSTDNSADVVSRIHDSRIMLISQKNAGVSAARNRGIREAAGRYVCFLDADDIWEKDYLETVENLFNKYPEAGMVCPSYQISYGKRVVHPEWRGIGRELDGYVKDFYEMATAPFWICNCSCGAIKNQVLKKMDYWFPEGVKVYEDFEFWLRVGGTCKVAHSNKVCVTYQRETVSNARKEHEHKIVFSQSYMKLLDEFIKDDGLTPQQKKYVKEIKDRRTVPYIYSLLLANKKSDAKKVLNAWNPCISYKKYKRGLLVAIMMPGWFLELVQAMRMRLF